MINLRSSLSSMPVFATARRIDAFRRRLASMRMRCFDADIALSLCAGLLLDRLENGNWPAFAALVYAVPLAFLPATSGRQLARQRVLAAPDERRRTHRRPPRSPADGPSPIQSCARCFRSATGRQRRRRSMSSISDRSFRTGAQRSAELVRLIDRQALRAHRTRNARRRSRCHRPSTVAVMRNYRVDRIDDDRCISRAALVTRP